MPTTTVLTPLNFCKLLADATRLQAVLLIQAEQELCVCELTAALHETQPKISRHLAMLRRAGVLQDRRQGQWVYYRLHDQLAPWASAALKQFAQTESTSLDKHLTNLAAMGDRPKRKQLCQSCN